jgi:hypothetical protein
MWNTGSRTTLRTSAFVAIFVLLCLAAIGTTGASANLPPYDGLMSFPAIHGLADPEEFSWEVQLGSEQELVEVDEQKAEVVYTNHTVALEIAPALAHDAKGTKVPTSLKVSGPDVITLIVHHHAGNPAAAGAPFTYPITSGAGWTGGGGTVIVVGPKDAQEEREQKEREAWEALRRSAEAEEASRRCVVPSLRGRSLRASAQSLRDSHCRMGQISRHRGFTAKNGKVVKQNPRPGTVAPPGMTVAVTLGK